MPSNITPEMIRAARDAFKEKAGITIYLPDEGTLDDFEQGRYDGLCAALSAALSAQPVAVKPLEWDCSPEWRPGELVGEWFVYSIAGHYRIWHDDTVNPTVWRVSYPVGSEQPYEGTEHETLDAAKAAAQADYDARILSALEVGIPATLTPAPASSEPVAVPSLPTYKYLKPREFLLFASYCGDEDESCTDHRPCAECLAMSNVYGEDGKYLRQLGAAPPAPTGDGWRPIETMPKEDGLVVEVSRVPDVERWNAARFLRVKADCLDLFRWRPAAPTPEGGR